jgi:DNA mismatch repair protein MutS2
VFTDIAQIIHERKRFSARSCPKRLHAEPAADEYVRAGDRGYSVLRRPANWNPDEVPDFEIPETLDDDQNSRNQRIDVEWWSNKNRPKGQQSSSATPFAITNKSTPEKQLVDVFQEDHLDLFQRSLDTLDFPRVLNALYQECTTVPGKRIVMDAITHENRPKTQQSPIRRNKKIPKEFEIAYQPLTADTVEDAQSRYQAIREMEALKNNNQRNLHWTNRLGYKESLGFPPLSNGFNLESILEDDTRRVLEGPEILEISDMLDTLENIRLWNDGLLRANSQASDDECQFVELPKLASCITVNATLQDLLHNAFEKEGGRLSGTTFPKIGTLRARVRALKMDVMGTLDGLLRSPSIKNKLALESGGPLYSEINNGGRLVIPVDRKYASAVGIVHDTSRSGKTVYVEPHEIIESTNELRQVEGELRAEEARIWKLLTWEIIHNNRDSLETSVMAAGQLDLVMARYQLGQRISGIIPQVCNGGIISLRNAKHPILLLRKIDNVVGSDVDLGIGKNQGLVLTGPNAGGKTVILKLLGLVALMARSGIPVPAADASANHEPRVDFFNPVLADIGDMQSVGDDLSTFSGHMLVCREVLMNSGRNALVLMDELGSGTDPNQGVAIAQALLEAVVETGARVAITTHYMQLKQLAASDDRFSVAAMQFVNGRPTYKLEPGAVGESFALSVAERLGLPQSVIDRATELLDADTRQMGDLIREMEDQKALIDRRVEELENKQKEMASIEFKMKEEQLRLEKKQLSVRREEARKFAKMLEEKEQVLQEILEKLKSDPSRRVVAKSWEDIKFLKRDALNEAENIPSLLAQKKKVAASLEEIAASLVPIAEMREKPELREGDRLVVCKKGPLFGRDGVVTKVMGGRVEIQVNNMKMVMKASDVALPNENISTSLQLYASNNGTNKSQPKKSSTAKAADKAIAAEGTVKLLDATKTESVKPSSAGFAIRTPSNTVDVRGCTLLEAQEMIRAKFSSSLMSGRYVVYILHGHGTGGTLKTKIRGWLKTESDSLVKNFGPADSADGGDAFTRVELR